jgi:hypothetical protein
MSKRDRGQYVYELVNEGAGMTALRVGVVVRAGSRQYAVCWESGHRNRYPQGYAHKLMDWAGWTDHERRAVTDQIFRHCGI